jgi:hypothetical protein
MQRVRFELCDSIFRVTELHALYCGTVPGERVWTAKTENYVEGQDI